MASSMCPRCEHTSFEIKENSPANSKYKMFFVQCRECGTVIGALDYFNLGTIVNGIDEKLNNVSQQVRDLNTVHNSLNIIYDKFNEIQRLIK